MCIAEIVLLMRISSWNFVRVPKAMLWVHVQNSSLKFSSPMWFLVLYVFARLFWRAREMSVKQPPDVACIRTIPIHKVLTSSCPLKIKLSWQTFGFYFSYNQSTNIIKHFSLTSNFTLILIHFWEALPFFLSPPPPHIHETSQTPPVYTWGDWKPAWIYFNIM